MISIIIPVFNEEKYIKECLDSIVNQYKDNSLEIILIDDASTDNTYLMVKEYEKYHYLKIYRNEENEGLSYSRNLGIKISKGDYIMFVDGDDKLMENAIENIEHYIKKSHPDVIIGMIKGVSENGFNRVYSDPYGTYDIDSKEVGQILVDMQSCGYKIAPSVKYIISKEFLNKKNIYFECIHHEDQLWSPLILLHCNSVEFLDNYFYYYRLHSSGLSQNTTFPVVKDYFYIINVFNKKILEINNYKKRLFLTMRIGYLLDKVYNMLLNISYEQKQIVEKILYEYNFDFDFFKKYMKKETYILLKSYKN